MKSRSTIFVLTMLLTGRAAQTQQVDSIFFHLYTDSLKKGTYNYINVDGKTNNNSWLPLTTKQIDLAANAGRFDGNSLVIDKDFEGDSVTITAILKSDRTKRKSITIYIKKIEDK